MRCLFITLVLLMGLYAQVEVKSVSSVLLEERGLINNPVWSRNSKALAFEFNVQTEKIKVMIYKLGSNNKAKLLYNEENSGSTLLQTKDEVGSVMPTWSSSENNTLYFLYDTYQPYFMGKLEGLSFNSIPVPLYQVEELYISLKQNSGVSEYHSGSVEGVEYIFIRQQNSPRTIYYTDQSVPLHPLPGLDNWLDDYEGINSFSLSKEISKIIICKGVDKNKKFILGDVDITGDDLESIDFTIASIPTKSEDGVLQEPSFNPANNNMIAYLEMVRNSVRENSYQLFLQTLNTNHNLFLTDSLYRNEQNKISKANSTSYVWHPNGNYIFFITTNAKRNVAYVDLNNISNPKIRIMKTGVEFAEQLAISPNGKYLAVMTMIASETDDTDALGQLLILELQL